MIRSSAYWRTQTVEGRVRVKNIAVAHLQLVVWAISADGAAGLRRSRADSLPPVAYFPTPLYVPTFPFLASIAYTFCKLPLESLICMYYDIVTGQLKDVRNVPILHRCLSHIMKNAKVFCKKHCPKHYRLPMHLFGLLTPAATLMEMDDIISSMTVVFFSSHSGHNVQKHFKTGWREWAFMKEVPVVKMTFRIVCFVTQPYIMVAFEVSYFNAVMAY
ncbi:hypothetical protein ROHU_014237 [Labeo rohita]|uniref:Uncharacterized protein n=1 Tax=Labeo rohita TaxID=84645 RepID=A0A498NTT2_LABRO|nr:hypothetical protein ROHU_014237 [Labeo rohita]